MPLPARRERSADPVSSASTLEAARSLFNEGSYLAAHELLEELWEETSGPDADCYKGLLQAAVALHHLAQRNAEGALRLYRGHRRYLAPYLPEHLGLDLAAFLEAMRAHFEPLLRGEPEPAGARPRLERRA